MSSQISNENKGQSIEAIAEQWVNLVFAHLDYKRKNKKTNKKEYKNGKQ